MGDLEPPSVPGFRVRDFEAAFRQLAAEDQQILLLIGLEGMSHQDAADVLRVPLGTLMLRLWQIRKRLRSIELRTRGASERPVRPLQRSTIFRQLGGAKTGVRQRSATVVRLARH